MNTEVLSFLGALKRDGCACGTQIKYVRNVERFLATVEDPLTITKLDIENYIDCLAANGLAAGTIRLHVAALRRFYDHLEDREKTDRNPLARIKPPRSKKKPIQYLREDEDEAMYLACVTPQERIVFALLRYAGLRVGEACSIKQRDIDLSRDELRVTESKTDCGLRTIPINERLHDELVAWFARLPDDRRRGDLPVLVTSRMTSMKAQFAHRLVKRIAQRAGVRLLAAPFASEVSCHTLRRTFATHLLNKKVRMETVSALLGHADTRVTQASYAELLSETVRAEFDEAWSA